MLSDVIALDKILDRNNLSEEGLSVLVVPKVSVHSGLACGKAEHHNRRVEKHSLPKGRQEVER